MWVRNRSPYFECVIPSVPKCVLEPVLGRRDSSEDVISWQRCIVPQEEPAPQKSPRPISFEKPFTAGALEDLDEL